MGCRILSEGGGAGLSALYDSAAMVAFGPVMPNATWAEGFLGWLGRGPRSSDGQPLIDGWAEYERTHAECAGCGVNMARRPGSGEALCGECGADEAARPAAPPAGPRRGSRYHMASPLFGRPPSGAPLL
jgi:hypothetical protein